MGRFQGDDGGWRPRHSLQAHTTDFIENVDPGVWGGNGEVRVRFNGRWCVVVSTTLVGGAARWGVGFVTGRGGNPTLRRATDFDKRVRICMGPGRGAPVSMVMGSAEM